MNKSTLVLGIVLVFTLVNSFALYSVYGKIDNITTQAVKAPDANNQENPILEVNTDGDPVEGSKNAPVTIVEFSDFQCPYCGRFAIETLSQIKTNYIDTGKVKVVYKDFPLSFHENAQKAAEAAQCSFDQDKFWEFHDKIFQNQQDLSIISLKRFASELGLNTGKFNECLDSGKMAARVQKDVQEGASVGISGTPAFLVNGIGVTGAQPFEVFKQIIDSELSKAS